jgi:ubiquitin C-terminal hydrolase
VRKPQAKTRPERQSRNAIERLTPEGIQNLGNTCYANSVLQILFSLPELQSLFETPEPLSSCLHELKLQIYFFRSVTPEMLFSLPIMNQWRVNIQQDAHEFLLWLLQTLHVEHLNHQPLYSTGTESRTWTDYQNQYPTLITKVLVSEFRFDYVCQACDAKTSTVEHFRCVTRYIHSDLSDIEQTGDITERPCPTCAATCAKCSSKMIHCPDILFVMVMRFSGQRKNNKDVPLQTELLLKNNTKYSLVGVIHHHGLSSSSGHYTAQICCSNVWLSCDDSRVVPSSLQQRSSTAYILCYRKNK